MSTVPLYRHSVKQNNQVKFAACSENDKCNHLVIDLLNTMCGNDDDDDDDYYYYSGGNQAYVTIQVLSAN